MNPNLTDITIVLDRSASMSTIAGPTIAGFNEFLDAQKKAPGEALLTLNQFDDRFDHVTKACPVKKVRPLSHVTFVPRGSTALLDAIGQSIDETGARLSEMAEAARPGKVVFVVITDGEENVSTRYSIQQINDMIRTQRDKYSWEIIFLGANQDAIATATRMGVVPSKAMTYAPNATGTRSAFAAVGANVTSYRATGNTVCTDFSEAQQKQQHEAGA